ncbi:MAG: efflux RND transporter periplasmic adaptor subunit [Alphaproteobacteria bacterium]|nr:efflux RND transporter periplasmic adaptor subunit [Alphaproteobacteria bacterium]
MRLIFMLKSIKLKYKLALILVFALFFCFFIKPEALSKIEDTPTLSVDVMSLIKQNINLSNEYVGYVIPINSLEVMANVSGYIDEIFVKGGDKVNEGDNLLLIDQKQYKADFEAANASLKMAEAEYFNAKNYYNRIIKAGKNAVSASDIDNAKASFLSAEAKMKQAKAEVEKARVILDYTVLQSSINGLVGAVGLTKGDFISAGQTKLFDVIQTSPIRVEFAIPDKDILNNFANLTQDSDKYEIKLKLADNSWYQNKGKFAYFDNKINKLTSSLAVFVDFENPDNVLLANSYVTVAVSKKLTDVFVIDRKYVRLADDGAFVYVIKNNSLRKEKLKILGYYNNDYVTDNDFAKNDFLVVGNVDNITAGTKLKIKIIDSKTEAR